MLEHVYFRGYSLMLTYINFSYSILNEDFSCLFQDSPPKSDMEQKLRSASSVDELMTLIYPSYWAALKCTSKLSTAVASTASKVSQHPQPHLLRPLADPEESTFAAAYLNLDVLKSIESEWRKTQCMPKEVCVDVGREFGAPTNIFYKPPCVSVYRCGGCCHSEDKQCKNISTGYLSKTVRTNTQTSNLIRTKTPEAIMALMALKTDLINHDWQEVYVNNTNQSYNAFLDTFLFFFYDRHCPLNEYRSNCKKT
uniref:Platelet-derived growth factor (PDGF) family profile domain-containing protein n=1 Tax=Acanthochromis polyacanthus TaxID=80966 RepID=A0A3Q1FN66_9TELE